MLPANIKLVIKNQISEAELSTYLVGFDLDSSSGEKIYRLNPLINILVESIPDFAYGPNASVSTGQGNATLNSLIVRKCCDAAKSIYKIDEFARAKDIYLRGGFIADEIEDKYLKRGEFGELILYVLLKEYHNTIPLLSKIYFKDSYGATVHGFDAVHIQPSSKTLWLGESKLYINGLNGIKALIKDIKEHFTRDYLNDEFAIVSKKIELFGNPADHNEWLKLMDSCTKLSDKLTAINIPLLCVFTSNNFTKYNDETLVEFVKEYEAEMRTLKEYFDTHNDHPLKGNLNIILLLFPVQDKNALVKEMHKRLQHMQSILV
jgi:hypothetical protein